MRWEFKRLFIRAKKNFGKALSILWDDLKSAAYELFVQIPKDIKTFLKTLWAYKALLWEDRDWDHSYILQLLQLKIRRTREYIELHKRHENWEKDVLNMNVADAMIEKLLENDFGKELCEAHDKKWGPSKHYSVPVPGDDLSYLRSDRANTFTAKDKEKERKEYSAMLKEIGKLEEKAWEALWKHLSLHMRSWWD